MKYGANEVEYHSSHIFSTFKELDLIINLCLIADERTATKKEGRGTFYSSRESFRTPDAHAFWADYHH